MRTLEGFGHGINLGGWLSQCVHTKEHYDTFITEEDIKIIAGWGVDHVRLPIDYELLEEEDGTPIEEGYEYIETCIRWCKAQGLHLILDLHKTAGYVFDDQQASQGFFEKPELLERFTNLWISLAKHFAKDKEMLVFELLNEIVDPGVADQWNQLIKKTTQAIRNVDGKVRIMYGGIASNSVTSIKLLEKPEFDNIIFNFHCYEPLIFTHQGAPWAAGMPIEYRVQYPDMVEKYVADTKAYLEPIMLQVYGDMANKKGVCTKEFFLEFFKEAVEIAESYDVPLYCGEYGVIDRADPESTLNWYRDITAAFDAYGIGRAAWSYKKMDFGLQEEQVASVQKKLLALL